MSEPLPLDVLADPYAMLALLGSFWGRTYGGRDEMLACCDAAGDAIRQARQDLSELILSLSRYTVPIFHRRTWYLLYLRRSGRLSRYLTFGDDGNYGAGIDFGAVTDDVYSWPCPPARIPLIFNRLADPSRSLTCGIDFTVHDGIISFRADPFADQLLPARDILDANGTAVDREIALWCFGVDIDKDYIYKQYGYMIGLKLSSSKGYRDVVNALLDALVGGTASEQVGAALAALTGTPYVRTDGEVVQYVERDGHGLVVITDRDAYRFPAATMPVVGPGDVLRRGDQLVDTVAIFDLNTGGIPGGLGSLAIGTGILTDGYYSDLVFQDRDVPLAVVSGPGRLTRVSWELGGHPADVERFWDDVHARGIAEGRTLAHLLDIRPDPSDEPDATNLPATVNPLRFLIANLLRGNTFLVRVRAAGIADEAPGLGQLRLLRRIVPPHVALIVLVDLPPVDDSVKMAAVGEEPDSRDVGPPLSDTVIRLAIREGSEVKNASDTCF
jgi:hypothetical protein